MRTAPDPHLPARGDERPRSAQPFGQIVSHSGRFRVAKARPCSGSGRRFPMDWRVHRGLVESEPNAIASHPRANLDGIVLSQQFLGIRDPPPPKPVRWLLFRPVVLQANARRRQRHETRRAYRVLLSPLAPATTA